MKYIIFQENYVGVGGYWYKTCQVADSLKEWVNDEYNLNGQVDVMKSYCAVFTCQDEQAEAFREYWKAFNELEDKLVNIIGMMPVTPDEELEPEELAQKIKIEKEIKKAYKQAWYKAIELGLEMLDGDDIDEELGKVNPNDEEDDDDGCLYIVTHSTYVDYGVEVYVDGIFPYKEAIKVASEIEYAEIRQIKVGEKSSFMAGSYYE